MTESEDDYVSGVVVVVVVVAIVRVDDYYDLNSESGPGCFVVVPPSEIENVNVGGSVTVVGVDVVVDDVVVFHLGLMAQIAGVVGLDAAWMVGGVQKRRCDSDETLE